MLDDRVLAHASALEIGDELMVSLVDDRGNLGQTVTTNDPGLVDRLAERLTSHLGRPIAAESRRWIDRPASGGLEWAAYSAAENGLAALTVSAARVSHSRWLGGALRNAGSAVDPDRLAVDGRDIGGASFDEIAAWLPSAQVAWVRVDPRVWAIGAIQRLDALCRILQVSIAIDVPAGSLATPFLISLRESVPMATLGRLPGIRLKSMESQRQVFSIGQGPA
ncbi:MAG: hypothetical protein ACYC2K_03795 [Gemmatimonadales bacterium]